MAAGALVDPPALDGDPFAVETLRDPIPLDTTVREAGPVVWLRRYGVWATGRHATVERVFRDWEVFSSAVGTGLANTRRDGNWRQPSVILEVDPPDHDRTRRVMTRVLSPAAARRLKAGFAAEADRLVDTLVARHEFDAARDLAEAFPLTVLPDAVGMAPDGREHLLPYADLNFNSAGPRNQLWERAVARAAGALDYVVWQTRRESLRPDGFGAEIYAAADAGEISAEEAALLVRSFISAGIDTTVLGIGLTISALLAHPEQWAMLRARPALARQAFEETLRYTAPSPFIGRTTRCATEIDGIPLEADSKVVMFVAAANRDPRQWDDPDRFDLTRRAQGHLALGAGIHGCVGQMIARLEAECVLSALARKVSSIEPAGEPEVFLSNWLRGWSSLPVRVTPA